MKPGPISEADKLKTLVVIYTWPDGREEIRYRRIGFAGSAQGMKDEIDQKIEELGDECPYRYDFVDLPDNPPRSEEKEIK